MPGIMESESVFFPSGSTVTILSCIQLYKLLPINGPFVSSGLEVGSRFVIVVVVVVVAAAAYISPFDPFLTLCSCSR